MGVGEANLQVIDRCRSDNQELSNNIPLRYILTSSDYGACNSHYILHL